MIENFNETHLKKCADIFFDIYKNEPFNYCWLEYKSVLDYFSDIFKTPKFKGFVFFEKGIVAGMCVGTVSDYFKIKKYHISEIFIIRELQGYGLGSKFLSEVEKKVNGDDISIIEITTDKSTKAFDFYIKNKYTALSDNINMIKMISNF